ncbi:MAG TPA: OsmC family protein [Ignavibacteria bacterium]|nr:OsmC family protein [Ignavibacteria bacterium]
MVQIDISYEGGFHCVATHIPSGNIINTDAPLDNKGKGEAFSPTDLFAASLGVCGITTMDIKNPDPENINLAGTKLRVEKYMTSSIPRKIEKIKIIYELSSEIPENKREELESIAKNCPVALSLKDDLIREYYFNYVL